MPAYFIVRHGKRRVPTQEKSGDGPLLPEGKLQMQQAGEKITNLLKNLLFTNKIDFAVVSGAVRCVQSYALVWEELLSRGIEVQENIISRDFFTTDAEDEQWAEFWATTQDEFERDKAELGEAKAYLKHTSHLIIPCVERTVAALRDLQGKVFLIVTHGPHESLITEALTGVRPPEPLKIGEWRIVQT